MRLDFHIHTYLSKCSNLKPRIAVKKAEEAGLDLIALINHDLKPRIFKGSTNVRVIPGVEVSTREGHILIINTKMSFSKGMHAQDVIDEAKKDRKSLIIIPHPFDFMRKGVGGNTLSELNGYHAVEVNARCLLSYFNNKVIEFADKNNKPLIAGSDSHFDYEIGNAVTTVNAKTINQAINKIKRGETELFIKKRSLLQKLKPFIMSMTRPK